MTENYFYVRRKEGGNTANILNGYFWKMNINIQVSN